MLKGLRSILPLYRPAYRPHYRVPQHGEIYNVKRVRIVRPLWSPRRAQTAALYISAFAIYWHFVLGAEIEVDAATRTDTSRKGAVSEKDGSKSQEAATEAHSDGDIAVSDEGTEDAIFIPLGMARQCPRVFYKGSDVEWQSFIEFAHNKRRNHQIRHQLVGIIGRNLSRFKQFQMLLGQPIKPGKYWLNIDYPDGPPPEYERGGLEITDDYIAWSTRPVSAENHARLRQVLWPDAISSSIWASYSILWSLQVARFKEFFNIKPGPDQSLQEPPGGFVDFQRARQRTNEQQPQQGLGISESPVSKPPKTDNEGASDNQASSTPKSDSSGILPRVPSLPPPGEAMTFALAAFKRNLARKWKSNNLPAPRGTCVISGLVELVGPKGTCVLEVSAAYHPGENRFVSLGLAVRRAQPKQQAPRGGP